MINITTKELEIEQELKRKMNLYVIFVIQNLLLLMAIFAILPERI